MRSPVLNSWPTLWSCCIIWTLVVLGQPLLVESKPVRQPIDLVRCYNLSRNLVNVVAEAITKLQDDLDGVFNCSYEEVDIEDVTANTMNTVKACLPSMPSQTCICSEVNTTDIEEGKCLTAISSDLKLYMKYLQGLNPTLDNTVANMLRALKVQDEDKEQSKKRFGSKSQRQFKQCTVIHYFQLRAITIARVFSQLTGETSAHQNTMKQ